MREREREREREERERERERERVQHLFHKNIIHLPDKESKCFQ